MIVLVVMVLIGVPVTYTLFISAVLGLLITDSWTLAIDTLQSVAHSSTADFTLSPIFTFILMAEFLRQGNLLRDLFETAQKWLSAIPGGLAIATTLANGMMAAMSGSSVASAAAMSRASVPEMRKQGYDDRLSLGTVSAAGTLAAMIPPSLGLIIYGVITRQSISALFIAGIIPGILTMVGYIFIIIGWAKHETKIAGSSEPATWGERFDSLRNIWASVILIVLVLGGLYAGVFTPSESGAIGAIGAFFIGFQKMSWDKFRDALWSTVSTVTMVMFLIFPAKVFGRFLTLTGVTNWAITTAAESSLSPLMILIIILFIYILLGTMMDQTAILILTLPLTFPLVTSFGYDPIWFGVLLVKTVEIGLITPPFGLNVYVASGAIDADVTTAFRGASRFLIADFIILALLLVFPIIATWLPKTA